MQQSKWVIGLLFSGLCLAFTTFANEPNVLKSQDIFDLEYASDLTISADGKQVYFVRHFMDIQTDRKLGNIWTVNTKTKELLPVTSGDQLDFNPVLSPDGKRLAFISTRDGSAQIYLKWLESGHEAKLSRLTGSPSNLTWSPDGQSLAFQMFVGKPSPAPVSLPGKPPGSKWADPAVYIDDVFYRFDGAGYGQKGSTEIFLLSSQGGSARQLTNDDFDNSGGMSWSTDGKTLYFSANRNKNADFKPLDSNVFALQLDDGTVTQLTDRDGPDTQPKLSPDGKSLAFLGFDDTKTNYENAQLYVMSLEDKSVLNLTAELDRSIDNFAWQKNGRNLVIQYDDKGRTLLALQGIQGSNNRKILTDKLGGESYGRPYTSAQFSLSSSGVIAFTYSDPMRPADVAVINGNRTSVLTQLNEDALGHKDLAQLEELWFKSKADGLDIQGWLLYPPGFDSAKQYPLVLEIHGGPVTAYGPHFSMEAQLYAAAGNLVLYINPRGSSSYGKAFAHEIDKNYPSNDYDDLMTAVDEVIAKGIVDTKKLFVTGGSGGGVLTAWIVGHTNRFAAAVVAKPVINWFSFVLTADFYPYFYQYWFDKKPWEDLQTYMAQSPISYVGNVTTPTMLLTGESDYRTPISETEQYYQALKIQGVKTAMVRIPNASHSIYRKPSNLMAKVEYILWWFKQHSSQEKEN